LAKHTEEKHQRRKNLHDLVGLQKRNKLVHLGAVRLVFPSGIPPIDVVQRSIKFRQKPSFQKWNGFIQRFGLVGKIFIGNVGNHRFSHEDHGASPCKPINGFILVGGFCVSQEAPKHVPPSCTSSNADAAILFAALWHGVLSPIGFEATKGLQYLNPKLHVTMWKICWKFITNTPPGFVP
jgi:hypothetical protein